MKNTDIHRLLSRYYETWAGINAAYDRIAARCGVTSNVLYLLDTLYCAEAPMTQSEIGARLGLPKQTVASMVSTLERRGYVVREVAKDDHRRRHVLLTDEDRAYAKPLSETVCAFEQAVFERMEPDERLALVETSEKLQKALNTVLDSAQD